MSTALRTLSTILQFIAIAAFIVAMCCIIDLFK